MNLEDVNLSPIPSTLDKLLEAHYFLTMMAECYHNPYTFRFNLNGFIQSFRNITFMLQSEDNKPNGFDDWYSDRQNEMMGSLLLKNLVCARNLIVKKQMLSIKSKAYIGVFRGSILKLGTFSEVSPFEDTVRLLDIGKKHFTGFFIDEKHSSIGEQLGVKREWIVDSIGEGEVSRLCSQAYIYSENFIKEVHKLFRLDVNISLQIPNWDRAQIILETDLDPSLIEKWGWE